MHIHVQTPERMIYSTQYFASPLPSSTHRSVAAQDPSDYRHQRHCPRLIQVLRRSYSLAERVLGREQVVRHLPERFISPAVLGELEEILLCRDHGDVGVFLRLPAPVGKKRKKRNCFIVSAGGKREKKNRRKYNNTTEYMRQKRIVITWCPTPMSADGMERGPSYECFRCLWCRS